MSDSPDRPAVVEARGLTRDYSFGKEVVHALSGVTFDVPSLQLERSAGAITLKITATPAFPCVIDASTTLSNWTPIRTNMIPASGMFPFTAPNGTLPLSFYRVRMQ